MFVQIAVNDQGDDVALVGDQADDGSFGVPWKRSNPIDGVLDILQRLIAVGVDDQFHDNGPGTFARHRRHSLDVVYTADALFDGKEDTLLDLRGAGSGVGHGDGDDLQFEFRENLLFGLRGDKNAADHEADHE